MDPLLLIPAAAASGAAAVALIGRVVARRGRPPGFDRRLADALVRQASDLDRLVAALGELADGRDEDLVLDHACRDARRLLGAGSVVVLEPMADGALRVTAAAGVELEHVAHVAAADAGEAAEIMARVTGEQTSAAARLASQGELLGVLVATRAGDEPFAPAACALLDVIADFAARAAQNARFGRHLERLRDEAEARERERARLSNELARAEHAERRRLASALHDGPQQVMAGVGLMLDSVVDHLRVEGGLAEIERLLRLARDRSKECVRDLREMSFALEPPALREQGLAAAVLPLVDRISEAHGIRFRIDLDAAERLDAETQAVVFQIVREAIANAVKHAHASTVAVRARPVGANVEITVADDGAGMLEVESSDGLGQGTSGMRERAAALGGKVEWSPGDLRGTVVRLAVPAQLGVQAA